MRWALVIAFALIGCRDDIEATSPSTTPGPTPAQTPAPAGRASVSCELATADEVSEAAGVTMRVVSRPDTSGCSLESDPAGLSIEYMVLTRSAVFQQIAEHPVSEPVDVPGAEAYFVPVEGRVLAQLHVATETRMLVVTLRTATEGPDLRQIAERFGGIVGGRL